MPNEPKHVRLVAWSAGSTSTAFPTDGLVGSRASRIEYGFLVTCPKIQNVIRLIIYQVYIINWNFLGFVP